jgi:hypothetical protein
LSPLEETNLVEHHAVWGLLIAFFLAHFAVLAFLIRRRLTPPATIVMIGLTVVEVILAGLHVLTWGGLPPFEAWLFGLNNELALGTVVSSAQYMVVGLISAVIAFCVPFEVRWKRAYWLLVAAVFVFFGLDEYFTIHEPIGEPLWLYIYAAGGMLFAGLSVLAYWIGFRENRLPFAMLLGGLAVMAGSGLGMDALNFALLCKPEVLGAACERLWVLEEYFEMAGVTLVLGGLLTYAWPYLGAAARRRTAYGLGAAGGLWILFLTGHLWLFPAWEARLDATPVQASYLDDTLELVGYRIAPDVAGPGDSLDLTLYWRAHRFLDDTYWVSAHLLDNLDNSSVAQVDADMGADYGAVYVPDTAWLPGTVVRQRLRLQIPEDLSAPQSLRVMVRVWHRERDVWIDQTDRQMIGEDTIILYQLPVVADGDVLEPVTRADYRFSENFALYGYALPPTGAPGEPLLLRLWWQTDSDVSVTLQQYVHLIGADEASTLTYDRPPFGGRFPTCDWPGGAAFVDEWEIVLPDDLQPGEYEVATGLYDPQTLARQPVTDGAGVPVTDSNITLGTLSVGP